MLVVDETCSKATAAAADADVGISLGSGAGLLGLLLELNTNTSSVEKEVNYFLVCLFHPSVRSFVHNNNPAARAETGWYAVAVGLVVAPQSVGRSVGANTTSFLVSLVPHFNSTMFQCGSFRIQVGSLIGMTGILGRINRNDVFMRNSLTSSKQCNCMWITIILHRPSKYFGQNQLKSFNRNSNYSCSKYAEMTTTTSRKKVSHACHVDEGS